VKKLLVAASIAALSLGVAVPAASAKAPPGGGGKDKGGSSAGERLCTTDNGWAKNFLPRYTSMAECVAAAKNGTLRPQYHGEVIIITWITPPPG
jgi:hypothetical protein